MRLRARRRLDMVLLAIAGLLIGGVAAAAAIWDGERVSALWAGAELAGDGRWLPPRPRRPIRSRPLLGACHLAAGRHLGDAQGAAAAKRRWRRLEQQRLRLERRRLRWRRRRVLVRTNRWP
jgi:hypothetical protein